MEFEKTESVCADACYVAVSCRPAVEQFTQRIYGLPSKDFFAHHEGLLATLRQLLVPAQLQELGRLLVEYAQPQLQQWQEQGEVGVGVRQ